MESVKNKPGRRPMIVAPSFTRKPFQFEIDFAHWEREFGKEFEPDLRGQIIKVFDDLFWDLSIEDHPMVITVSRRVRFFR